MTMHRTQMKNDAQGIVAAALQLNIGKADQARKLLNSESYIYPWVDVSVYCFVWYY